MARWGSRDDRIEAFVNDMHKLTGELKVIAMGELLTTIIERQSAMMDRIKADARPDDGFRGATSRARCFARVARRGAGDDVCVTVSDARDTMR